MKKRVKYVGGISACIAMLIIILDSTTAVSSVKEGIQLCIRAVIPALLPFFVLSGIINSCFLGQKIGFWKPIRKICRIPKGTESIMLIGLISGYPVGAQLIAESYAEGSISKENAHRMLGFCSNAGPAFLFGILSCSFTDPVIPWVLWAVHIGSAILVGWFLPGGTTDTAVLSCKRTITLTDALQKAIRTTTSVCGWVILFRLILGFLNKWLLWMLPITIQVLISGAFELTNGCTMLQLIPSEGTRFILAGAMLSFGGLCIAMQTRSVTQIIGTGYYFPGKLLQLCFSLIVCCILQPLLFKETRGNLISVIYPLILVFLTMMLLYLLHRKKVVAFSRRMLYNNQS